MILDPNGMPILQPTVDNAETATFNDAFAAIGNTRQIKTYKWADNAARTAQTGMTAGDLGYQTDTGVQYYYSGSGWVADTPYRTATGTLSIPSSSAYSFQSPVTVTFPPGLFTQPPIVVASTESIRLNTSTSSITTTNFDFRTGNNTSGSDPGSTGSWVAVQATP